MWQQRQNNTTALNELTGLPGEMPMDKNAVWQKLESRLHKKTSRVYPIWYWAAACTAAAVFFLAAEFTENKTSQAIVDLLPQSHISGIPAVSEQKNIPVVITPEPQIKKNEYAAVLKAKPLRRRTGPMLKMIPPDQGMARFPVIIHPRVTVELSPVVDTVSMVSVPAKKKLNIVNTNELDDADRFASERLSKKGSNYSNTKNAAKKEYAGMLNFRIYLKN